MKFFTLSLCAASLLVLTFNSCSKNCGDRPADDTSELSQDIKDAIFRLGFTSSDAYAVEGGYIVEGDIFLTDENLRETPEMIFLQAGDEEQYRTYNLVTGLPRTITVSVSSQLSVTYVNAVDEAIDRYNDENLLLTFVRQGTSGGNIHIKRGNGPYLASAGFPTSQGNPYGTVNINTNQLNGQPLGTIASVIAHEIGHCIGMRHTDYFNRAISCGGSASNEGAGSVGAVHIPGTPTGASNQAQSWMLACIGSGQNRPFNNDDRTALNYLY